MLTSEKSSTERNGAAAATASRPERVRVGSALGLSALAINRVVATMPSSNHPSVAGSHGGTTAAKVRTPDGATAPAVRPLRRRDRSGGTTAPAARQTATPASLNSVWERSARQAANWEAT